MEGYVRQLIGWRDYVWHLYWHFGADYRHRNGLRARTPLPDWFTGLDADAVQVQVVAQEKDRGSRAP